MTEIRAKSIVDYFNEFAKVNAELGETLNIVKNTIKAEQTGEILTAEEQKKSFKTITDTTKSITQVLRDGLFDKVEDPATRTITYVPRLQLPPPGGMPAAGAFVPVPVGGPGAAVAFGDPLAGAPPANVLPLPVPAILNPMPGPLNDPLVQLPATPAVSPLASPVGSRPASPAPQGPQVIDIQEVAKMPQWYRDNLAGVPSGGELDINLKPTGLFNDYSIFGGRVAIDKEHFDVGELTMIDQVDGSLITNKKPITPGILGLLIPSKSALDKGIWRVMSPDELDWWYELVKTHYYAKGGNVKVGAKAEIYKLVKDVKDAGAAAIGPVGGDGIPILNDYIAKQGGLNNNAVYLYLADTLMRKYVKKDNAWTKTHGRHSDRYKDYVQGQDVNGLYRSWLGLVKEGKSVPPLPVEDITKIQQFLFPASSSSAPASSSSAPPSSSSAPPPPPGPPPSADLFGNVADNTRSKRGSLLTDITKGVQLKKAGASGSKQKPGDLISEIANAPALKKASDRKLKDLPKKNDDIVSQINQGVKLRKTPPKEPKQKINDDVNMFNPELLKKVKKMRNALTDDEGDFGQGINTKHSYTVQPDGTFGALKIDIPLLKSRHILKVKRKNKLIINQDVDVDTVRLLTQRFFSTKKYSDESKGIFTQLVKLAELPVELRNTKYKLITGSGSCEGAGSVYMFNKPDEAIDRLEVLIGSLSAGNNSKNVKNEMQSVMDYLLKMRKLTKAQHKLLYDTYILSR